MRTSSQEILDMLHVGLCSKEIEQTWKDRLAQGSLTRDENALSHFCCYFLPYNPATKEVFVVHHKKAGLWLAPGGHIDEGELPFEALAREIEEELGVKNIAEENLKPFILTITPIPDLDHPCHEHFDIWYLILTDGKDFEVDPREFHETRWCTIAEAREFVTDPPNLEAFERIESLF